MFKKIFKKKKTNESFSNDVYDAIKQYIAETHEMESNNNLTQEQRDTLLEMICVINYDNPEKSGNFVEYLIEMLDQDITGMYFTDIINLMDDEQTVKLTEYLFENTNISIN